MAHHIVYMFRKGHYKYIGYHKQREGFGPYEDDGYRPKNKPLLEEVKKHGWDAFHREVMAVFDNKKDALSLEEKLVGKFQASKDCITFFNKTPGGGFPPTMRGKESPWYGRKHTSKSKEKMSNAKKGENNGMYGRKHTEKTKEKMSDRQKGEKNSFYGKKHTLEAKEKISKANKGKKLTSETKRKIGEARRGKKHTPETKRKMSEAKKGKYIGEKNPKAKSILFNDKLYLCIKTCCEENNINYDTIRSYLYLKKEKYEPRYDNRIFYINYNNEIISIIMKYKDD